MGFGVVVEIGFGVVWITAEVDCVGEDRVVAGITTDAEAEVLFEVEDEDVVAATVLDVTTGTGVLFGVLTIRDVAADELLVALELEVEGLLTMLVVVAVAVELVRFDDTVDWVVTAESEDELALEELVKIELDMEELEEGKSACVEVDGI